MKPLRDYLNEITIPQIDANNTKGFPNTQKRQHSVNTVNVQNPQFVVFVPSNTLQVVAPTQSHGHNYKTSISFDKVQFQDDKTPQTITVHATDNQDHEIVPLPIMTTNIKVDCSCADFRFRFATQHFKNQSLDGNPPPQYIAKTNREPVNPFDALGACKHILAVRDKLRVMRIIR